MTVQNNSNGMNSYNLMIQKKKQEEEESKKLSSGLKINTAADDAAGLAISEKMRSQITVNNQAQQNAKDASNLVKTGEGAMQEINSMLNRATEISTQAANGTYTDVERSALQMEVEAIASEINRIAQSTNFNGVSILDGSISVESGESLEFQIGTDSADYSQMSLNASVSIDASQLSVMTQEDAAASLEVLKEFVDTITSQRAELGAKENRLAHTSSALSFMEENLQRAESEIRDTDMAKTASEKSQKSIQLKAAITNNANAQEQKKGVLNLLG